eukprot:11221415-Lingulodinium_polyedra.AAC.1
MAGATGPSTACQRGRRSRLPPRRRALGQGARIRGVRWSRSRSPAWPFGASTRGRVRWPGRPWLP